MTALLAEAEQAGCSHPGLGALQSKIEALEEEGPIVSPSLQSRHQQPEPEPELEERKPPCAATRHVRAPAESEPSASWPAGGG